MRLKERSPVVFVAGDPIICATGSSVELVKGRAVSSLTGRARICIHKNDHEELHEMLIALNRGSYVRPHKHSGKSESFHVVEGAAYVIIFEDDGQIKEAFKMAPYDAGKNVFYYQLSSDFYHTVIPITSCFVIHEVTRGPFDPAATIYAPWSPDPSETARVNKYLSQIEGAAWTHLNLEN